MTDLRHDANQQSDKTPINTHSVILSFWGRKAPGCFCCCAEVVTSMHFCFVSLCLKQIIMLLFKLFGIKMHFQSVGMDTFDNYIDTFPSPRGVCILCVDKVIPPKRDCAFQIIDGQMDRMNTYPLLQPHIQASPSRWKGVHTSTHSNRQLIDPYINWEHGF